jgi:hypothetical protein
MMLCIASTTLTSCKAQVKNAKTETVKIFGNCGMCETHIETAGNIKKIAKVDWNKGTKMATLIYDSTKTNQNEILKRIALAGYDSDEFLAPADAYNKLDGCCQYERINKTEIVTLKVKEDHSILNHETGTETMQEVNQLKAIFDNYFALKDALVKSDATLASTIAKDLLSTINAVEMEKLLTEEHIVWMKVMGSLKSNTDKISTSTNVLKQRNIFVVLSEKFYELLKNFKTGNANLLSKLPNV